MGDARTRRAAKVDENQPLIVKHMRAIGMIVEILGMPSDLLVSKNMITLVVEVKNPKKDPSSRRLTDQELTFYTRWHHHGLFCVIETSDDVKALGEVMAQGFKATHDFCGENMQKHFATCYKKKRK